MGIWSKFVISFVDPTDAEIALVGVFDPSTLCAELAEFILGILLDMLSHHSHVTLLLGILQTHAQHKTWGPSCAQILVE